MKGSLILAAAVLAGVGSSAQSAAPLAPATVAGIWSVSIANQPQSVTLDLKVEGSKVAGSFAGSAVEGQFKDGKLTCADAISFAAWAAGTLGSHDAPVMYQTVVFASLEQDGSLSGWTDVFIRGYGPQAIKRTTWTASRAKSKD